MFNIFRPSNPSNSSETSASLPTTNKKAVLLVIQKKDEEDWGKIFAGCKLSDGREISVVQCGWDDILVSADISSTYPLRVDVNNVKSKRSEMIKPDFCLVRNEVYTPFSDHRNQLYGLMYANLPSVNSLHSIYMFCERPVIQAEVNKINKRLGDDVFPLVDQSYFSNHRALIYGNTFPAVVKVGSAHAGYGKMKIANHHDMEDFRSVMTMTEGKFCTAEPFIVGRYDLRIQKIGNNFRAYKRMSLSGDWKTNTGTAHMEEIEMTEKYRIWAEEAGKMFGGLDILSVDAIHDEKTGKELIMEVNGTSSGFVPDPSNQQDNENLKKLVIEKMNACCVQSS